MTNQKNWGTSLLLFTYLKVFLEIQTYTLIFFKQKWDRHTLTKNTAIDIPITNPAITSDQWFRYSATLLIPVRKAKHIKPKHRTGFASLVPLAFTVLVIYIWKLERKKVSDWWRPPTNWWIKALYYIMCIWYFFFWSGGGCKETRR